MTFSIAFHYKPWIILLQICDTFFKTKYRNMYEYLTSSKFKNVIQEIKRHYIVHSVIKLLEIKRLRIFSQVAIAGIAGILSKLKYEISSEIMPISIRITYKAFIIQIYVTSSDKIIFSVQWFYNSSTNYDYTKGTHPMI